MKRRIRRAILLTAGGALLVMLILSAAVLCCALHDLPTDARESVARALLSALPLILITLSLLITLTVLVSRRLAKSIVEPLNKLNLNTPKSNHAYDELAPLLERIGTQQHKLLEQSVELQRKKSEFETATNHMSEGLVLLNEDGVILAINRSAVRLLGITTYCIGIKLTSVCPSTELQELLLRTAGGEHADATLTLSGQAYRLSASPTVTEGRVTGLALLVYDLNEKEKAEKLRQEFTANVSHELKTPLHSISGYAELLAGGMVRPEDVPQFSERIYTETRRLIALVEDIIKLSRLDEGAADTQRENVDLYALANATVQSLSPVAADAGVSLQLQGTGAPLFGIRQFLSIIIYNLCENAIKYNRAGGSVTVSVTNTPEYAVLAVRDTGIGIPEGEQERVFERFYRVDKSHSKSLGGTGLGLSIVKHAAKLHAATIKLHSIPDVGTTVTVYFPK
ncbi:MAG: PAS domain-containing sensor histidine kinase [Clostridia bacterium]|nr:PAS domain-containing sensor histidine kinase [Clostridia bacterium]